MIIIRMSVTTALFGIAYPSVHYFGLKTLQNAINCFFLIQVDCLVPASTMKADYNGDFEVGSSFIPPNTLKGSVFISSLTFNFW